MARAGGDDVVEVRDDGRARYPVVVGIDGSQGSARALAWALQEARNRQAPVRVVTAWAWGSGAGNSSGRDAASVVRHVRQTQEALVRAVLARFPGALPQLTTELVEGDPASTLIDRSRDGVLLVLGSQGLSGSAELVGSVADNCLRHGGCPVVVVPADSTRGLPLDTADPDERRRTVTPLGRGRRSSPPRAGLAPVATSALGML